MNKYSYGHEVPFEAFISNLGLYNEGELRGEWVPFPIEEKELEEVFKRIGMNEEYEEYFITDYDIYVDGLDPVVLGEYTGTERLNELSKAIEELNEHEYRLFETVLNVSSYTSIDDVFHIIDHLDSYELYEDINSEYDLGKYYIESAGIYDLSDMGELSSYIDYEKFGHDLSLEEGGTFTEGGYLLERKNI